jgi:hypothetical protein
LSAKGAAVEGELRWQSSVDYVRLGAVEIDQTSAPQSVTVNAGDVPVTFGTAMLEGERPSDFAVITDGCSGKSVPAGGSCSLALTGHPTAGNPQQATLVLADDTAAGQRVVPLNVTGTTPVWGSYKAVPPARILDTRSGLGAARGQSVRVGRSAPRSCPAVACRMRGFPPWS